MQLVRVCAELAQIRHDIERMPMGYDSLVGDMGSKLSRSSPSPVSSSPTARRPSGRQGGSSPSKAAWRGRRVLCQSNQRERSHENVDCQ